MESGLATQAHDAGSVECQRCRIIELSNFKAEQYTCNEVLEILLLFKDKGLYIDTFYYTTETA